MKLYLKANLPRCLERIILWPVLLYYRLRFSSSARFIYVGRLKFAIVDPADYDALSVHKWRLCRSNRTWYAIRTVYRGRRLYPQTVWMHHAVLPPPPGFLIDHGNHNGLDNRRFNLRAATQVENQQNARKTKSKTTSRYKGVDRVKATGKWRARIAVNGRRLFLGSFTSELDAAYAYDAAASKFFGHFACTNFN